MGRGIALYDNAIMFRPSSYDEPDEEGVDFEIEFEELKNTIATIIKGDTSNEWQKSYYLRHLQVIAENDKLQVCAEYEDTYLQLVVLPKSYSIWMKESKALVDDETSGYGYTNDRGEWIEEVLRPYSVDRDARRLFRKLIVLLGHEKFSVRTSAWTSCQVRAESFKAVQKAA